MVKKQAARICRGRVGARAGHCLLFCSCSAINNDVTDDGSRTSSYLATSLFVLLALGPGGRCLRLVVLLAMVELLMTGVLLLLLFFGLVSCGTSGLPP